MNTKNFFGIDEVGYQAFKNVWQQLYDYIFKVRKLNGCLLVFAPADYNYLIKSAELYYPGDEYVDILAPTVYTNYEGEFQKANESNYIWMKEIGKPIGFSEFSVRTGDWRVAKQAPVGDWETALHILLEEYPDVSWVNTWSGDAYSLFPVDMYGFGNKNGQIFLSSPYALKVEQVEALKNELFN